VAVLERQGDFQQPGPLFLDRTVHAHRQALARQLHDRGTAGHPRTSPVLATQKRAVSALGIRAGLHDQHRDLFLHGAVSLSRSGATDPAWMLRAVSLVVCRAEKALAGGCALRGGGDSGCRSGQRCAGTARSHRWRPVVPDSRQRLRGTRSFRSCASAVSRGGASRSIEFIRALRPRYSAVESGSTEPSRRIAASRSDSEPKPPARRDRCQRGRCSS